MRANIYIMLGNKTYNKICVSCGKEFTTKDKKQRFCSHDCYGILKVCKWCGKEFRTTFEKQDYCSRACGGLSRQRRVITHCLICGKEIETIPSHLEETKTCSKECAAIRQSNHLKGKQKVQYVSVYCKYCGREMKKRPKEIKNNAYHYCSKECRLNDSNTKIFICKKCGKEFKRSVVPDAPYTIQYCSIECRKSRVVKQCEICGKEFVVKTGDVSRRKHCGKECRDKAHSIAARGKIRTAIVVKCDNCGKEFYRAPSLIKGKKYNYCSELCMGEHKSKINVGPNNPNWNNGSSFEPYCEKFNKYFRQRVRAYFGDVCFICGLPAEEHFAKNTHMLLTVHHVHYDRGVCCNGNPEIFVPLCYYHNIKCNSNREWWVSWFESILLKEPYNGKTYFTHEEYVAAIKNGLKIPQLPNYNGEQQRPKIILRKI